MPLLLMIILIPLTNGACIVHTTDSPEEDISMTAIAIFPRENMGAAVMENHPDAEALTRTVIFTSQATASMA